MTHLISKAALVAEIEKMKNRAHPNSEWNHGYVASCEKILSFLDTLEVKEVGYIDTFIEKACEWLENHNDYQRVLDNGRGVRFDMTQCVIDFRKAMEGE